MVHPWDGTIVHRCTNKIMYHKVDYSKGTKGNEVIIVWFREKPFPGQDKPFSPLDVPDGSVVAFISGDKVRSFQLVPLHDNVTPAVLMDEFYRLWNYLQEKNWRGRIKDYDFVVGARL